MLNATGAWPPTDAEAASAASPPTYSEEEYIFLLQRWTTAIMNILEEEVRTFFKVLCCLDKADRSAPVLAANWPTLAAQVVPHDVQRSVDHFVAVLERHGLATAELGADNTLSAVQLHPVLAEYGRQAADPAIRRAVNVKLAQYWTRYAVDGGAVNRAAGPYLLRLEHQEDGPHVLDDSGTKEGT